MALGGIWRIVSARMVSWLIAIQALGVLAAALVAIADIESITVSGGPVCVAGLLIASVFFSLCKTAGGHGAAIGGGVAYATFVVYFQRRFYKHRAEEDESGTRGPGGPVS